MARHVKAQQVLFDILVGMTGRDLMKKYQLTPSQLAQVVDSLVKARMLQRSEMDQLGVGVTARAQGEKPSSNPARLANANPAEVAHRDCSETKATTH